MKHTFFILLGILCLLPITSWAQKEKEVHGTFTFFVGENDDITLMAARRKCIESAKAEAIKAAFGEMVTSDVIVIESETNGDSNSKYWENTILKAKGEWIEDTRKPEVSVTYENDRLLFNAEVWGIAREIIQAQTELQWSVLTGDSEKTRETDEFKSGERVFVKFRSPADGYVAIYLITGDDETQCLLPYKKNPTGRHHIKQNTDYLFFDKEQDPDAQNYKLSTPHEIENNELVIIYSKNPFTKCNEITGDRQHPNSLSTLDFQKWLLKCQRADKDMVVNKKMVKIKNS